MADIMTIQSEVDEMHGQYLVFAIDEKLYGIEICYVTEIIYIQMITPIPELPNYMKGIINKRGSVVPVMDMRLRFNMPEKEYEDRTCIICVSIKGMAVGMIVDSVHEVVGIPDEDIMPPPTTKSGHENQFINGIGQVNDEVRLLIDVNRIFHEGDEMGEPE